MQTQRRYQSTTSTLLAHAQPSINEIIPTESTPLHSTFGGIYTSGIQTTQARNLTRRSRRPKRLEESEERKKEAAALPLTGLIFPRISTAGAPLNFSESSPSKSSLQASRLNGISGHSIQDVNSGSRDFILEESSTAAVASIKGLKPGNPNWINQDNFILIENFDQRGINFYCVLDGHGEHGHHVSRRCREMLPEYIRIANQDLKRAFFLMQSDLQASSGFDANCSGATCAFVSMQNKKLTVANCGDSRVVLCSRVNGLMQARALSIDHKPDRLEERKRIISCGGRLGCRQVVVNDHGLAVPAGPCRVWYTYRGDSMGLAMSRSLGDLVVHNVGVSAEPEIIEHPVESTDEFLIIATDGIWDVIDSSQAIQLVSTVSSKSVNWNPLEAASLLSKFARARWTKLSMTADDITCIVVKLK